MFNIADIPGELRVLPQWVLWRHEDRGGPKATKVPLQARTRLHHAKTNDPRTWAAFETALEMWQHHAEHVAGLGFVFSPDDPYCGIDLDNVWQSDADEEGAPWALRILERFSDTYDEQSSSERGAKIWCRAKLPRSGSWPVEPGAIELYDRGRFFAVTGKSRGVLTITDHQADIEALIGNLDDDRPGRRVALIDGTIQYHTQHNTLVSWAGTMHRRGMCREAIEAALQVANRMQCERPGPEAKIRKIVASTAHWRR